MRSTYKIFDTGYPYFVTSSIVNWISIFTSEKYFLILLDNLKFYQQRYDIEIIVFVFMSNHFHLICKCEKLQSAIQAFKSYTAKKIIEELEKDDKNSVLDSFKALKLNYKSESTRQVWQEGFHPQQIIDSNMLNQKIEYIHLNPIRKKLVEKMEDWKFSSSGFYLNGKDCGVEITPYY